MEYPFPTLEDQQWPQQTTPLDQDLMSSVDLCQVLPQSSIQHSGPAEFILQEALNSELGDFDFSFDLEFLESAALSSDMGHTSSASSTMTVAQPAPESSPTVVSHQTPQSEDMRAEPPDKSKPMPQKDSSFTVFQCDKCFKSYPKKWQLNRHLKRYEKPFRCNSSECNAAFALRKDHRRHMKQIHPGFASEGDMLRCLFQTCAFSSTRRDTLKRHLQGVHRVQISFEASNFPTDPKSPRRSEQLCI
jgi:hypothetical protein